MDALDFQLVLLRRMADFQPHLVEDALRTLGVGRDRMRDANRHWQAMAHARRGPGPLTRYRSALGRPESTTRRRVGDLVVEAHSWALPLWRDLCFEVMTAPDGTVWNEELVRAPGGRAAVPRTVEDVTPWSCTIAEVARAFPPVRPMEGSAPSRSRLAFEAPTAAGGTGHVVAEFTWGLVQRLVT